MERPLYFVCKIGYYLSLGIKSDTLIETFFSNHIQEWQLSCSPDMIQNPI